MFLPEQGVIEWRNIGESFSFCQPESFSIGIIPNLRRRFYFIFSAKPLKKIEKEEEKEEELYLADNLDCSTLILKSLNDQLRRGGGDYDGGW